jgi:CheY-like chemotaxis protein
MADMETATNAFEDALLEALNHLYDPNALGANPLVEWLGLAAQPDPALALRQVLEAAISALRPSRQEPATSKSRRYYDILHYRYVEQLLQHVVAERIGVTPRHLRREQAAAIGAIGSYLRVQSGLEAPSQSTAAGQAEQEESADDKAELDREMLWLADSADTRTADIQTAVEEALELAEAVAQRHSVILWGSAAGDIPPVAVSQMVLKQIVLNLVTTAARSVPSGRVRVAAQAQRDQAIITVTATPSGDPTAQRAPWDRAALAMASQLAELFEGKLVTSEHGDVLSAQVAFAYAKRHTVLAVEDNVDTLQLWKRYVQGTNFELVGLSEASKAVSMAAELQPDMIVLDVMLPGTDGWELLAQFRHHPETAAIPVIVCTVLPQEELATALGASDFIRKPTTGREFRAVLERQSAALGLL